ncbi:MAG: DUF3347 domain-containing protein [Candidatus Aminicenantes bacterium]|nr:DUF3347 domain-containing protein [Candidatus Aminicenantes bacterium]NIM84525.1 DUF3347 domain-containing protein [Candidatus Aminicenantes bacterium]NIN24053.1 DUF3347 domain-containing protein [Candidatus Aminicenantes bacterium]NIN47759.1 DUF3347 domain-containing protein [Candidatus Aminicenantes bacterium]NIN90697.1 DUF3347 domain-containing protein [Candidatus Aminicenantes bacterium]
MKKFILYLTTVTLLATGSLLTAGMHGGTKESHVAHFNHYIVAQEALAADNFANAKKAFLALVKASEGEFKKLVETAARAGDIKSMRKAFKKISAKVAGMGQPEGYGVAFCPMADNNTGAYWVQKKGKITNPYFGSTMLRCGSFKKYPSSKEHQHKHHH